MACKYTKEDFVKKSKSIHGELTYDYTEVVYINAKTKVKIFCNTCEKFFDQTPDIHSECGCPKCAKSGTKMTTQEFIDKANLKHNNFYDYSKTEYIKSSKNIDIICPKHGLFTMTPNSHLSQDGAGCLKCYRKRQTGTFEEFLKNAIGIHGDKYEYHFTEYKGSKSKIKIFYKKRQKYFFQLSTCHTQGHNCPICARESAKKAQQLNPSSWKHSDWERRGNISKDFTGFKVYIIKCWNDNDVFYKIGKTYKDMNKRFPTKISMPYSYEVLKIFEGDAKKMSEFEDELKRDNRLRKYVPNIEFG